MCYQNIQKIHWNWIFNNNKINFYVISHCISFYNFNFDPLLKTVKILLFTIQLSFTLGRLYHTISGKVANEGNNVVSKYFLSQHSQFNKNLFYPKTCLNLKIILKLHIVWINSFKQWLMPQQVTFMSTSAM